MQLPPPSLLASALVPHVLSSTQQPEWSCKTEAMSHLSSVPTPPRARNSLAVKAKVLPSAHRPLQICPRHLPVLISCHSPLHSLPPVTQACPHPCFSNILGTVQPQGLCTGCASWYPHNSLFHLFQVENIFHSFILFIVSRKFREFCLSYLYLYSQRREWCSINTCWMMNGWRKETNIDHPTSPCSLCPQEGLVSPAKAQAPPLWSLIPVGHRAGTSSSHGDKDCISLTFHCGFIFHSRESMMLKTF